MYKHSIKIHLLSIREKHSSFGTFLLTQPFLYSGPSHLELKRDPAWEVPFSETTFVWRPSSQTTTFKSTVQTGLGFLSENGQTGPLDSFTPLKKSSKLDASVLALSGLLAEDLFSHNGTEHATLRTSQMEREMGVSSEKHRHSVPIAPSKSSRACF